jgi:transcriptional regulator with XRE-family HTH domain
VTLGSRVRELRREQRMTQTDLARRAGISASYVSKLEANRYRRPSAEVLLRLASALNVPVDELYKAAGYPVPAEEFPAADPELALYLSRIGRLSPHDQRVIKNVIRGMLDQREP